jgi:hypothetical protein
MKTGLILTCLGLAFSTGVARADPPTQAYTTSLQPIACWAIPANNPHYAGYYVGGGCARPRQADGRVINEGTWGWDYRGWFIPRDIMNGWWHGRRYQGGTGAYQTDGPH